MISIFFSFLFIKVPTGIKSAYVLTFLPQETCSFYKIGFKCLSQWVMDNYIKEYVCI